MLSSHTVQHSRNLCNGWYARFARETHLFDRITHDAAGISGKARIREMRVTVGMIVGQIGAGHTIEQLLAEYP